MRLTIIGTHLWARLTNPSVDQFAGKTGLDAMFAMEFIQNAIILLQKQERELAAQIMQDAA